MSSLSETTTSNFIMIANLPVFYQEILCRFNEYERHINGITTCLNTIIINYELGTKRNTIC